jgi:hypothetical protein
MQKHELRQIIREEISKVINEGKKYSFTFDYNTDDDDVEYIQSLLKKTNVKAKAKADKVDSEIMVVKADSEDELRKAKKAISKDGFQIHSKSQEYSG